MTEREYFGIKNLGLVIAANEVLEEIMVIDDNGIIRWDELNALKSKLIFWRKKLQEHYLTSRKNDLLESQVSNS